jgi:hypothetical protein
MELPKAGINLSQRSSILSGFACRRQLVNDVAPQEMLWHPDFHLFRRFLNIYLAYFLHPG